MTIERGAQWGAPGPLPVNGVVARSDRELRSIVERARRANQPLPPVGLLDGDLSRTLGGPSSEDRVRSADAMTFTVDIGAVLLDGRLHWFVAHLLARRSWWRGRVLAVMNAQFVGEWDVAPRAHPNDGRLEVLDANQSFNDRLLARRRLRTGTHVPHPDIKTASVTAWQTELAPQLDVWLDGEKVTRARLLSVRVEPDALTVVV